MTTGRTRGVRTQVGVRDQLPQNGTSRLVVRLFGAGALAVAALTTLLAGNGLALSSVAAAGAGPAGITVNCPADNLQDAINAAAAGSTLLVTGTCTGSFYINKNLTLSGPATLDGGGVPTTYGAALNVMAGTVVLNNVVIQHGVGIDNFGGGLWNGGQLTLNHSTVAHNTAYTVGGIFNTGQLTLNGSRVSNNTATNGDGGGILNCGADPGLQADGLCTGAPGSLTLNNSVVSNNAAGSGGGGGIANDPQAAMTLSGSVVSGNTTSGNGGGIENDGTATLNFSTVSGNSGSSGGGTINNGIATLNLSLVSGNASTGAQATFGNGGGLSVSSTASTALNYSVVRANSAVFVGGGIFAGGPLQIDKSIVTGNAAHATGGGMVVWNGSTAVANSAFFGNSDQGAPLPDTLPGVLVAPADYEGLGNSPSFTTTRSLYL